MLRDYQIEICERVREAFARHRSVMMQMPTGTGKTVVLAEIVREYLNVNVNVNVKGGCNVLIVAHRRELVEQIQQALLRVMGAEDLPHPSSPARRFFENHPPSPSLPLKKGLHRFPLNPLSPQGTGDLKPGRPGLYSQASSRPVGVARELPTQQSCDCLCAEGAAAQESCDCLCSEGAAARESCDYLGSEGAAAHIAVHSIQWLSRNIEKVKGKIGLVIVDEAHHAVAKTYRMMWEAWPEAKFLGLTATPYRLSGEGFTDLFEVMVESWSVKRFIAEGWLSAFDYYSILPESDEQRLIDSLKKRGVDGDFQMKEMHEALDVTPCIERLFQSFERFAYDKKGIVYAIDIEHAEHIAEYYRQQGVAAYAISSKTPIHERRLLIEAFRKNRFNEDKSSGDYFEDKSSEFFENHPPSPSLPLKKGLHRFPLNPLSPQGTGDLKPGRLGLYEQASSRPFGVARELPTQQSCDYLTQQSCDCLTQEGCDCLTQQGCDCLTQQSCDCLTQQGCDCFIQVLVSVDLFSEGFDCPDVEFIQMARPTLSLAKYLQMVGRGLRAHQGKECVTIIDNVGLYRRFGLPSGERDWERYFEGLKDEKNKELKYLDLNVNFDLNIDNDSVREERGADLVKIIGHEGMATRFEKIGKEGFERKRKDVLLDGKRKKVWIWRDTLTGITFERHPVVVDFKGVEMMTDDGLTFYPRIRSKWVDEKSGINRKALETQVGDGFGWMKKYVSLREPDKVYELQEVMENGMRVYKDEDGKTFFQQDPDCPLVNEEKAGGKKAFMALCDKRKKEWEEKVMERRRDGFININGETVFKYEHRPVERTRGFVNLVYDGDLVYITNIHEERFIAYHNWEIRADDGVCTIGNKLYLKSKKDGKALRISKRSGDFQMFVVNVPVMAEDNEQRLLVMDAKMMIINRYGKNVECQRV